jgi:hypothetical protein
MLRLSRQATFGLTCIRYDNDDNDDDDDDDDDVKSKCSLSPESKIAVSPEQCMVMIHKIIHSSSNMFIFLTYFYETPEL